MSSPLELTLLYGLITGPLLRSHLIGPLNFGEESQLASHMIDNNANQNLHLPSFDIPKNLHNLIQAIPTSIDSLDEDLLVWAFTKDGNYSLSSAYITAKGLNVLNLPTHPLSQIWKVNDQPKMLLFLWLCSYNSIPIQELLGSRGLSLDQSCPICRSHPELRVLLLSELLELAWASLRPLFLFQAPFPRLDPC